MTTNPYDQSEPSASPAPTPPAPRSPLWAIVRSVLGLMAGILAGGIVVALIEIPGMFLHPPPPGFDLSDAEAVKAHMAKAPFAALLGVAIAWTAGPLVGSFVAASIARWGYFAHGMIIASIFAILDVMNILSFPHPRWLTLVGVLAPWATGWIGSALAEWMFAPRAPDPKPYDMRKKNMAC